jgi:hypothetical protein
MTEQKTWGGVGRELIEKLKGITDEASIKALGDATIQDILSRESTPKGRANALRMVSREITKQYPRLESEAPAYWHDARGKESQPKWRHLIFKSLTLSTSDWDEVGDESRQEWKAQQQKEAQQQQKEVEKQQQEAKQQAEPEEEFFTLDDLIIDEFQLDAESQSLVEDAIALSGMTLADLTRQALRVYSKTITGKTRKQSEDLATVPTDKLLNDPTYSTHPGRAEELTKRAIKAIRYYNANVAVENADRWCITQSAIASLTGSRPSTVGKVLGQFKDDIESHNQTYNLDNYSNRKRGKPSIEETINLAELTPFGLD